MKQIKTVVTISDLRGKGGSTAALEIDLIKYQISCER